MCIYLKIHASPGTKNTMVRDGGHISVDDEGQVCTLRKRFIINSRILYSGGK